MCVSPAFISAVPLRPAMQPCSVASLSARPPLSNKKHLPVPRPHVIPLRMLQSPTEDGPPRLETLDDAKRVTAPMSGPPVVLGTHRVVAENDAADAAALGRAAGEEAFKSLSGAPLRVAHVTVGAGIDLSGVVAGVRAALGAQVAVLARGAPRRDADGMIEVLLLGGGSGVGVGVGECDVVDGDVAGAAAQAGQLAARKAASDLGAVPSDPGTWPSFGMFACTPGGQQGARSGMGSGVPVYGGEGLSADAGPVAGVCTGKDGMVLEEGVSRQRVGLVLLSGKVSFLVSAVVKAWAQPAYVDSLPFLTPTYVGDAKDDLLTAIRFNDWERFIECMGDENIDANVKWENRQNQSPLLAAVARGRAQMVEYLISNGADPSYRNDGGYNAVMYAGKLSVYNDEVRERLMKMLIAAGADPNDTAVIRRSPTKAVSVAQAR